MLGAELTGVVLDAPYWGDRDLVRAASFTTDWPTTGAELSYGTGARLPGGLGLLLLALARLVTDDPLGVWRLQVLGMGLGALALGLGVRRVAGDAAGTLAGLAWLTTPGVLDVGSRLWNPGQAAPFFAALSGAGVVALGTGHPGALVLAGLLVGLAGQLHATAWLLGLLGALVVLVVGPGALRRALPLAVVAALVPLVPHAVDEALHGWPNTLALLDQSYVRAPAGILSADGVGARLGVLVGQAFGPWPAALGLGALALVGVILSGALPRRVVAAAGVVVAAIVVWIGLDRQLDLFGLGSARYAAALFPALAVLLGAGAGALRARGTAGRLVVAVLIVLLGARGVAHGTTPTTSTTAWARLTGTLDDVQAATGWSLSDALGRTASVSGSPDAPRLHAEQGVDALLLARGEVAPGPLGSPCALVVGEGLVRQLGGPQALTDTTVAALMPRASVDGLVVTAVHAGRGRHVVVYDLPAGRCPTTFSNRYLPTEGERLAWEATADAEGDALVALPDGSVALSVAADVGSGPPARIALLLALAPAPGRVGVTLSSNQLRGLAYNEGFYRTLLLDRPRLVFSGEGGEVVVPLARRWLGDQAELTPVRLDAPLPPGTWIVALETGVVEGLATPDTPLDGLPVRPARLVLPEPLVVPPSTDPGDPL